MKNLKDIILEKFIITKNTQRNYNYFPKTRKELCEIIEERLKENKDADLNDIDTSQITDMDGLFQHLDPHNINISGWDVSKVIYMNSMFYECQNFNANLSNWKIKKVKYMQYMFCGCTKFTGEGLDNWKVENVEKMDCMFSRCENLNVNLDSWNPETAIDEQEMFNMFDDCPLEKNPPKWYINK